MGWVQLSHLNYRWLQALVASDQPSHEIRGGITRFFRGQCEETRDDSIFKSKVALS
jgi:hypothetical protein